MASNNITQQQQQQQQQQQSFQAQQQQQQQLQQQQRRCSCCSVIFDSIESLEVHRRRNEWQKQWGESAQGTAPAVSEEKNNNMTKHHIGKREFSTLQSDNAADNQQQQQQQQQQRSPDYHSNTPDGFYHPPTPQSHQSGSSPYQSHDNSTFSPNYPPYQTTIKVENHSPVAQQQQQQQQPAQSPQTNYANYPNYATGKFLNLEPRQKSFNRYQPYPTYHEIKPNVQTMSPLYPPQPTPSPSPKHCDKCGYEFDNAAELTVHKTQCTYSFGYALQQQQQPVIKEEDTNQSEILDLDSKEVVHPPWTDKMQKAAAENIPHSVSTILHPWNPHQPQDSIYAQPDPLYGLPDAHSMATLSNLGEQQQQQKLYVALDGGGAHPQTYNLSSAAVTPPNGADMPQAYRPFELLHQPNVSPVVASPPANPPVAAVAAAAAAPPNTKSSNWKSNEARRPKTYNCSACNKWFTSSGHLKRHYNTTLHKNAVKSSGNPDPATLPISTHHHPARDVVSNKDDRTNSSSPRDDSRDDSSNGLSNSHYDNRLNNVQGLLQHPPNGPYDRQAAMLHQQQQQQQQQHHHHHHHQLIQGGCFGNLINGGSPNGDAGLSPQQDSRGLLTSSSMQPATSPPAAFNMLPQSTQSAMMVADTSAQYQMYPNELAPHVTQATDIPNNHITGELSPTQHIVQYVAIRQTAAENHQPLPSFDHFAHLNCGAYASVGGLESATTPSNNNPATTTTTIITTPFTYITNDGHQQIMSGGDKSNDDYKLAVLTANETGHDSMLIMQCANNNNNNNNNNDIGFVSSNIGYGTTQLTTIDDRETIYEMPRQSPNEAMKENFEENLTVLPIEPMPGLEQRDKDVSKTKCFHCDKVFNRPCYLTQHNKTCHAGEKPFKCSRCGKRFSSKTTLDEHVKKHAGDKPHKCDECPKQFNHKTDLRRHNSWHTGKKPYACEICNKGFIRKDHMVKHMDTHKKKRDKPLRH